MKTSLNKTKSNRIKPVHSQLMTCGLIVTTLFCACGDEKHIKGSTTQATSTPSGPLVTPDSSSTILASEVSSADYTVEFDDSNNETIFYSYDDAREIAVYPHYELQDLLLDLDTDSYWGEVDGTVNCPISGTATQSTTASFNDGNGTRTLTTENCEFYFGSYDAYVETTFDNWDETITKTFNYTDDNRTITVQSKMVYDWENGSVFESFINDSEIGSYFTRSEFEYSNNKIMFGANNTYVERNVLPVYDETYSACIYEFNLNGIDTAQTNCVPYFDVDSQTSNWVSSGGKDALSTANAIYELSVTEYANFSITLDSLDYTNTYLYVMDDSFNVIAESGYGEYGEYTSSGLGIELTAGTYYITAATHDEAMADEFALDLRSNIESSATSMLIQEAIEFVETRTENIDTVTGNWTDSEGAYSEQSIYGLADSVYELTVTNEADFLIELNSEIDTYMYLLDQDFNVIDYNDDYNGLNSRLSVILSTGTYYISATTFSENETGSFELNIHSDIADSATVSVYQ